MCIKDVVSPPDVVSSHVNIINQSSTHGVLLHVTSITYTVTWHINTAQCVFTTCWVRTTRSIKHTWWFIFLSFFILSVAFLRRQNSSSQTVITNGWSETSKICKLEILPNRLICSQHREVKLGPSETWSYV